MGLSVPANDADHDSILGAMNEKIANKANGHASGPGMRHKVKFVRRGWGRGPYLACLPRPAPPPFGVQHDLSGVPCVSKPRTLCCSLQIPQ
jgi:hypothetical protein